MKRILTALVTLIAAQSFGSNNISSFSVIVNDANGLSQKDLKDRVFRDPTERSREIHSLQNYLSRISSGGAGSLRVSTSSEAVATATGTLTFASALNADTVTIDGVVWTATSGTAGYHQFKVGVSNGADATSFASQLNASSTALISGFVSASATAAGVVTLTALVPGQAGNLVSLASSNGTRLAVSGSGYLTGGTGAFDITSSAAAGPNTYKFGN